MTRFYCNGKKGYCERGNDANVKCDGCEFLNGEGGRVVEAGVTNYEIIKNMSVTELAGFICDIYSSNEHKEIRINGKWILPEDVEEWLGSEVQE